ncbi:MAG: hypothetical protein EXR27_01240 [Betaproteobacteria bacterium]|nr:hypothetical protein [Betaproteobacteria bacterium]
MSDTSDTATEEFARLVESDRVHRRVYTDPVIFEAEMQRVFARAWIYVAHESQIPRAGDFTTTTLAGRPVVVVRHADGSVRALHNRCAHRGAIVAAGPGGNARTFQCSHHGWTYRTDGALDAIPAREGYAGSALDPHAAQSGMPALARVTSYRGFVFASLAPDGPDLVSFLGPVALSLDNMVDRSPEGAIEIAGGSFRLLHRNNWKIYLENLQDGVHALPTHQSTFEPARRAAREATDPLSKMQAEAVAANSQSPRAMAEVKVLCHRHGHSEMMAFRRSRATTPEHEEYERRLADRLGPERMEVVFGADRHNAAIYPGLTVQPAYMQLRRVVPLRVDLTRVDVWILRLRGAPESLNRRNLAYANAIHSPASLVRADDMENFERTQHGLGSDAAPWVSQHRGFAAEPDPSGPSNAMSERYIRNQFAAWRDYMRSAS